MTTTDGTSTGIASSDAGHARTRRLLLVGTALGLAALDLVAKAVAQQELLPGQGLNLGVVDLQLAYNSGTAFSLGAGLPRWLIVALVSAITAGVLVFAWREAPNASPLLRIGLTGILAGAVANLIDRAGDGLVTDYFHTGWWPTFNLADVFITIGAAALLLATAVRPGGSQRHTKRRSPS